MALEEGLDLAATYFAPLGGFGLGFFVAGPKLGGAWALSDVMYAAIEKTGAGNTNNNVSNACDIVGGAIFGGIFIGCGYAVWRSGSKSKWIGKGITGLVGGFLAGWGTYGLVTQIGSAAGNGGSGGNGYFDKLVAQE